MSGSGTEMVDLDAEMEQDVEAPTGAESKTEEARVSKNVTLSGLQIYDDAEDFYDAKPQIPLKHYGFGNGKAGVQELQIGSCGKNGQWLMKPGFLNPWASLIGFSTLLGFALYCIISPKDAKTQLAVWQSWCTMMFSWFYIASQNVWIVFLFVVYYYYGNVRLGKQTDKPEFDNSTYFAMLFSCGVAVGLFVYGTAEPLYHYDYWVKHRFNGGGHETQNDKANFAILTTMFHWGFHGWCVYTLVGLQMGIMAYKYMLPMTMRTCFYPLLHKHTWGWIGSCIDGFSIVTIVAGVCTSLGLGAVQIRRGLEGMDTIVYYGAPTDGYLINDVWSEETATWSTKLVNAGLKTTGSKAWPRRYDRSHRRRPAAPHHLDDHPLRHRLRGQWHPLRHQDPLPARLRHGSLHPRRRLLPRQHPLLPRQHVPGRRVLPAVLHDPARVAHGCVRAARPR